MPVVPMRTQGPIQDQGMANVRLSGNAPAEAFGNGQSSDMLNSAANGLAKQAYDLQMEEKRKADDTRTVEANAAATKAKNDLLYNPQYGVMTKRGKDAFGVMNEFTPLYKQKLDDIAGTLSNDDQREMFKRMSAQHSADFDTALNSHVSTEAKSYAEETAKSGVAATIDDAVQNYQNPEAIAKALTQQEAIIRQHGTDAGYDQKQTDLEALNFRSKTHGAIISRMIDNGNDLNAKKYYDANKDSIGGVEKATIEKELEAGSVRGESQRLSDQIMASHGDSLMGAMKAVRQVEGLDPKVREATEHRIEMEHGLREKSKREYEENLSTKAGNVIDQGGDWPPLPTKEWQSLPVATKSALESYAAKKAKGDAVTTDFETYYGLKTLAGNPATRDVFLKKDLTEYVHKIALPELKELTNDQTEARKGNAAKLDGYLTPINAVNGVLNAAGIDPTPKQGSKDAIAVANFQQTVNKETMALEKKLGRSANADEVAAIAKREMISGITEKRWYWTDKKKHMFELNGDEKFLEIDVPDADKAAITNELVKRGKPATKDAITKWYLKGQGFGK